MRLSSETSTKNLNHPHASSFSMQGSLNSETKNLTPNRNSFINLKQAKPKIFKNISKSKKVASKGSICDSKSASIVILPSKKRPPTCNQLKGNLKHLKDKSFKSFSSQADKKLDKKIQDLLKTPDCEVKNIEEISAKLNEDCTLVNRTKHKKSFSLNLDLIENSGKILCDQRMYSKPLKTTKNSKVKSKKMFGSSKKSEKNAICLNNPKLKNSSIDIPKNRIENITVKNRDCQPKINSNNSKSKGNISFSPKFSQKKIQPTNKNPKQVKGIIRASKYTSIKSEIGKTLDAERKSPDYFNKSSAIPSETDEWVNFIDYKFEGTASGFVQEFKAKILEEFLLRPSNLLNEGRIHSQLGTTENLYSEDLEISPSDSFSNENLVKNIMNMTNLRSQQVLVPKLALNDIITQDSPSFLHHTLSEANCTSEMIEGDLGSSYNEIEETKNDYFCISSTKDGSPNDGQIDYVGFRNKGNFNIK